MIHCFETIGADEAWRKAISALIGPAGQAQGSRAGGTRELLHVVFQLQDPKIRWIVSRREALNVAFALAEVVWILDGRNDSAFLNYFNRRLPDFAGKGPIYSGAYGERLRKRFGFDQLKRAAEALSVNSLCRQIVLQIWESATDFPAADGSPTSPDVPCNVVSMLKVRGDKLDWTQIMRSNDAYRGTPHNIVQFTFLQEVLSGWIGLKPGTYTHWSDSFHLYEEHLISNPLIEKAPLLPDNNDTLSLPLQEFEEILPEIREVADAIINHGVSSFQLVSLLSGKQLPLGWANIMRVLTAEGIRRRGNVVESERMIEDVTNPSLSFLWERWTGRLAQSKSSTVR